MGTSPERLSPLPALRWWPPVAIALATLAAFAPVLFNQFIDWDDGANFLNNPSYRGLGPEQLGWMASTFHRGVYQPLAWLLAAVEYRIGGVDPWVYHAGSWLLHALAAALTYALARRLFDRIAPDRPRAVALAASGAALLWAIHPLRVEAVAWASAQGYPLAAVFALGSTLAWWQARDGRAGIVATQPGWYWASVALAVCAYLAKPIAVTLPVILVILTWYRDGDGTNWSKGRTWLAVVPYAVPAILVAAAAPLARTSLGTSSSSGHDVIDRLVQACYGASYYVIKTVFPTGLTVFTPLPRPFNPWELRFVVAAMGVVAAGGLIWWTAGRAKGLVATALAYLVLLAPVLGLVRQGDQLVADRYSYFAGVPLSLGIGGGLLVVAARVTPRVRFGVIGTVLVALVVLGAAAWHLTRAWHNAGSLWKRAVAVDPASYQAHTNRGLFELRQGRYQAAVQAFDAAIALNPASSNARFDRGLALAKWGRTDDAIAAYQAGLLLDPADATAHAHLGDLFASQQRWSDAENEYRIAIRLAPHPDLFNSLGTVLAQQHRLADAVAAFRDALAIDPAHDDARANLETALQIRPAQ